MDFAKNINPSRFDTVYFYIIYQSKFRESYIAMNQLTELGMNAELNSYKDKPIKFITVEAENISLIGKQNHRKLSIIYVTPLRAFNIDKITNLSQSYKILTLTAIPDYVAKGISIGFDIYKQQPKILINIRSSKAEGYEFSSQLLKLAKVIE
jgi:hypothetical protein